MTSLLSSPRRRRRLAWAVGILLALAGVFAVFALVPSHTGPAKGVRVAPHAPVFGQTTPTTAIIPPESPAEEKARTSAEAAVRPLARRFVSDLLLRRDLPFAYALFSTDLRNGASLNDWQQGRDLPLAANASGGSVVIAFSGATSVGIVSSIGSNLLVAMRFDKAKGHWRIDYLHQGHSSSYVDDLNYAPAGFLPGSHAETLWTWLALISGFLAIVAVAVFFESWLRDSRT